MSDYFHIKTDLMVNVRKFYLRNAIVFIVDSYFKPFTRGVCPVLLSEI